MSACMRAVWSDRLMLDSCMLESVCTCPFCSVRRFVRTISEATASDRSGFFGQCHFCNRAQCTGCRAFALGRA